MTLQRLRVVGGAIVAHDQVPQPAREWHIDGLDIDAVGIATRPGASPGKLTLHARINDTPLALEVASVVLGDGRVAVRVTLDGFDLTAVRAYLAAELPAVPTSGRATLDLLIAAERAQDGTPSVKVTGDARVEGLAVVQRARPDAFLTIGRVAVKIKDARPLARDVTLASVEIDALDLRVRRDREGRFDLLALAGPAPAPPGGTPHLTSVADFLRRAPGVPLTLAPVPVAADVDSLRAQELTARLQQRQREKGLPDFAAAVAAEFTERFPDTKAPASDEQLARLREAESVPDARVGELPARRLAVVRDGLVRAEGVPETRVLAGVGAPPPPAAEGEGRVEFRLGQ